MKRLRGDVLDESVSCCGADVSAEITLICAQRLASHNVCVCVSGPAVVFIS